MGLSGPSQHKSGNWHPLTWLSHMLDVTIWDGWAGGHRLTNVVLHAANARLLFLIMLGMTGALFARSVLVAALFATHPLHVESVAWVAERKDVLSTFFGLLALGIYLRYTRQPSARRYVAVTCLFVCSLMAKQMWVTFPFLLLLIDIWPLGRWNPFAFGPPKDGFAAANSGAPGTVIQADVPQALPQPRVIVEKIPLIIAAIFSAIAMTSSQRGAGFIIRLTALPFSTRGRLHLSDTARISTSLSLH